MIGWSRTGHWSLMCLHWTCEDKNQLALWRTDAVIAVPCTMVVVYDYVIYMYAIMLYTAWFP